MPPRSLSLIARSTAVSVTRLNWTAWCTGNDNDNDHDDTVDKDDNNDNDHDDVTGINDDNDDDIYKRASCHRLLVQGHHAAGRHGQQEEEPGGRQSENNDNIDNDDIDNDNNESTLCRVMPNLTEGHGPMNLQDFLKC